jgi:hypothetical protein
MRVRSEGKLRARFQVGTLRPAYKGQDGRELRIATSTRTPLSLASADLNHDGYTDLVAGYATRGGGLLAVHFANPEAFSPKSDNLSMELRKGSSLRRLTIPRM